MDVSSLLQSEDKIQVKPLSSDQATNPLATTHDSVIPFQVPSLMVPSLLLAPGGISQHAEERHHVYLPGAAPALAAKLTGDDTAATYKVRSLSLRGCLAKCSLCCS